ncbi:MAG TPA: acetolactate synthase small subunit [bacterium]|uniref:Acetolactate synthase small subunit n=1 Tax=candidate division TA06 bacterium ADurb.Bin417 TaxID=1852828 RepID=A0A1V5MFX7_UNCT6|nr:MAG: Acetolactate synthase isozyme 3 small subunit [candidate division TA06 bacterium ADurb.Bin417]HNQ35592.1 acetolactate synthase small subunit [bacterium]HNS48773.1 acetolactate synthase small subunit [bacterium]
MEERVISLTVENRFGLLAKVAGLFSARGYNINSLVVAPTEDPEISRMVLTTSGDQRIIEQIIKQLNKVIGIIKVTDLCENDYLERELLLVKVNVANQKRTEIIELAELFKARIIDVARKFLTIELVSETRKVDGFLELLKPYGLKEVLRTGTVAVSRE